MKTLIINAHPDPHAAEAATNRMVQHLVARLPAGSTEIVNLAEADIQPLDKDMLDAIVHTVFQRQPPASGERAAVGQRALIRSLLATGAGDPDSRDLLGKCLSRPELLEALPGPEAERVRALGLLLGRAAGKLTRGAPVAEVLWTIWNGTGWPDRMREAALVAEAGPNGEEGLDADSVLEMAQPVVQCILEAD